MLCREMLSAVSVAPEDTGYLFLSHKHPDSRRLLGSYMVSP